MAEFLKRRSKKKIIIRRQPDDESNPAYPKQQSDAAVFKTMQL